MGDTHFNLPPIDLMPDGDDTLSRYVAIAENSERAFVCIFIAHAENEQDCRKLIARWFLRTEHGANILHSRSHFWHGFKFQYLIK